MRRPVVSELCEEPNRLVRRPSWTEGVLAAGRARLTADGEDVELTNPRVVDQEEAWAVLPDTFKRPPAFLRITEFLRMDLASE